jgi:hypothetical protein
VRLIDVHHVQHGAGVGHEPLRLADVAPHLSAGYFIAAECVACAVDYQHVGCALAQFIGQEFERWRVSEGAETIAAHEFRRLARLVDQRQGFAERCRLDAQGFAYRAQAPAQHVGAVLGRVEDDAAPGSRDGGQRFDVCARL